MQNIYGISLEQLEQYLINKSYKKFKATQIYEWLYKKRISNFDLMNNIKKDLIDELKKDFSINQLKIINKIEDVDVIKYLFQLIDGNKIEAVLMKHDYGNSLCVSSQVGCNMGCLFCESGRLKKIRNLTTDEMTLQILMIEEDLKLRISHIVLMGIGEPLDNYENVMNFINIINNPKSIDIGARHITLSTCGIVPKIKEFINNNKQINLAISLHAPNDELRNEIMPINKIYKIKKIIDIIKEYINKTNRRVTFEYIMLKEINDTDICAFELAKLLKGINCYVNLIPYNETSHIEYKKSSKNQILKFYDILKKNKINVTIRKEFGSKVNAACGQLRSLYEEE
ncbi:MAG: 23S rRNA (adenine(2503)-C(2))-methyltransferase RlmN [Bacilli bacterium]